MSIDPATELARFQEFITNHLTQGAALSPEEALDLWRADNPSPAEYSETVQAIRQAISDMDAGDHGAPLDEFDREFRKRHGLPSTS